MFVSCKVRILIIIYSEEEVLILLSPSGQAALIHIASREPTLCTSFPSPGRGGGLSPRIRDDVPVCTPRDCTPIRPPDPRIDIERAGALRGLGRRVCRTDLDEPVAAMDRTTTDNVATYDSSTLLIAEGTKIYEDMTRKDELSWSNDPNDCDYDALLHLHSPLLDIPDYNLAFLNLLLPFALSRYTLSVMLSHTILDMIPAGHFY